MELVFYFMFIPCFLSIVSCSIFLYFYFRYDSVFYTFGMKHVAILQTADLLVCVGFIITMFPIYSLNVLCVSASFTISFSVMFSSFWVATIARFSYRVLCLHIEKENISILKPAIIGVVITTVISVLPFIFKCYKAVGNICRYECEDTTGMAIFVLECFFIFCNFCVSAYSSAFLLRKLKKDLKNQSKEMKWSFIRLTVYPFITFVCLLPAMANMVEIFIARTTYVVLNVFSISGVLLIGFFNSFALGFTREFRDALRFNRKLKTKPLIN